MPLDEQIRRLDADECIEWYSSIFDRWWGTSTSLRRPIYMLYRASMPSRNAWPSYKLWQGIWQLSAASTSSAHVSESGEGLGAPSSFGFGGWLQYKKHTINKYSNPSTWHGTRRRSDILNRWKVRWIGGWLMHQNWWLSQRKWKTKHDWR